MEHSLSIIRRHEKMEQESLTRMALQVAVYALLKMAIEVENLLSQDRHNIHAPVKEILSPKMMAAGEFIENQLSMRHSELLQWFRIVELPRIAGFFSSLLKKWSIEYAGRFTQKLQPLA